MMDRILLVRLGALGDIVHAIPVAAALRRAFPSARIDWLVSARHRAILDLVPVIDRRLAIGGAGDCAGSSVVAAIGELRRGRYDVALDLQGLLKSAILARSSGATRVVGFTSRYLREGFARPFYTDVYDPGGGGMYDAAQTTHVVRINLGLLEPLGLSASVPEFPIERVDTETARRVRDSTGGRYALVNPGAAWPNKRWPPERLAGVARALRDRRGLASIVLWGPGEESLARGVVAASSGSAQLSPRTTIADLVALVRQAAVIVSGDTGPTHIAAAVGTPIVGIYGPTRPARNGPWSPYDVTVSRDAVCQCHHLRRCKLRTTCLLDISIDEVVSAVERRLASEPIRA